MTKDGHQNIEKHTHHHCRTNQWKVQNYGPEIWAQKRKNTSMTPSYWKSRLHQLRKEQRVMYKEKVQWCQAQLPWGKTKCKSCWYRCGCLEHKKSMQYSSKYVQLFVIIIFFISVAAVIVILAAHMLRRRFYNRSSTLHFLTPLGDHEVSHQYNHVQRQCMYYFSIT